MSDDNNLLWLTDVDNGHVCCFGDTPISKSTFRRKLQYISYYSFLICRTGGEETNMAKRE